MARTLWLLLSAAVMVCAGCTVGPDFKMPDAPAATGFTKQPLPDATTATMIAAGEAQRFEPGRDIPGQWWELFHSPALNALIEKAIKVNPDLQSANAALRVAMENVRAQQGAYFPQVTAGLGATRAKEASQLSPVLSSPVLLYNLYQAQLGVTWTLDIFGGNRRQVEALQAEADAQRFQLEATYLALTANIVAAAVQEAALRAEIAATEDIVKSESSALDIMRRQNASGQIAGAAVAAQEAVLAQAQETLPPLHKALAQQRDVLTALAGNLSADEVEQTFELASLELPQDLPVSMPSKLVEQRPDIRVAGENLHAASAEIGVATANMLPNITLGAGAGSAATTIGQLFQPGNGFWSIGANLAQPVFEGGTLLHRKRAAVAAYDEAAATYRKTVIAAFEQVADALYALQFDADALRAAGATEAAASRSLAIARRQLDLGQISYIGLLTAQQTYEQALATRVQAQAGRYADTAVLFQALGGGWWNRSDAVASAASAKDSR